MQIFTCILMGTHLTDILRAKANSFNVYYFISRAGPNRHKKIIVINRHHFLITVTYVATISIASSSRSLESPFFFSRTKLLFLDYRFRERRQRPVSAKSCLSISVRTLRKFATYYRHYIESARSCKIDGRRDEWGSELSSEKKRDKADRPPAMMAAVWRWLIEFFDVAFLQYFLPYSITVHSIAICSLLFSRRLSSASYPVMSTKLS